MIIYHQIIGKSISFFKHFAHKISIQIIWLYRNFPQGVMLDTDPCGLIDRMSTWYSESKIKIKLTCATKKSKKEYLSTNLW